MCLYPKLIKNRKYISNKKNGGNIPPLPIIIINGKKYKDTRVLEVPVGCGKCMECLKQKNREWAVRLQEEIRHDNTGKFITLTFSPEELEKLGKEIKATGYLRDNEIATLATRRFLERWRKDKKKSVKHWFVTELGQENTEHIHIHGIIWTNESEEYIKEKWKYGNIWIGKYTNEKTVNYITKYINKIDPKHKEYKPKILTSQGIGKGYFKRTDWMKNRYKQNTDERYTTKQGVKLALPIYYRNKIYEGQRRAGENTKLEAEGRKTTEEAYRLERTSEEHIKQEKLKTIGMITDNIQKEENVKLTRKQQWQIDEAIEQNWEKISLHDTEVNIKIAQTIINGIGTIGGLLRAGQLAKAMREGKKGMEKQTLTNKW